MSALTDLLISKTQGLFKLENGKAVSVFTDKLGQVTASVGESENSIELVFTAKDAQGQPLEGRVVKVLQHSELKGKTAAVRLGMELYKGVAALRGELKANKALFDKQAKAVLS